MSERLRLAEHFIKTHGQDAARALEELPPDIAGSLIDRVSDPLSMAALKALFPYRSAKVISAMPPESASRYLAALPAREAAAILRHTDRLLRTKLIDLMPRQKIHSRLLGSGLPVIACRWRLLQNGFLSRFYG